MFAGLCMSAGISANTISGLAQQQLAHAASFQSYGNFLSDQYGTRKTPASQAAVGGGGAAGPDPRYNPDYSSFDVHTSLATGLLQGARVGIDAGLTGAALAGGFGLLPRVFDPFTTTLGSMKQGFAWGKAAGGMGAGIIGGLGYGLATGGAYYAAGKAFDATVGQVFTGVHQQSAIASTLHQNWNRANLPFLGSTRLGFQSQQSLGQMVYGMTSGHQGMEELTGLLGQGLAGGSFRDVCRLPNSSRSLRV